MKSTYTQEDRSKQQHQKNHHLLGERRERKKKKSRGYYHLESKANEMTAAMRVVSLKKKIARGKTLRHKIK